MRPTDIGGDNPVRSELLRDAPEFFANGGSAIAAPTGEWVVEPVVGEEGLIVADLDHARVREERHNFDLAGHYSRPDVTRLVVNRARQAVAEFRSAPSL
jgi:nitrilase